MALTLTVVKRFIPSKGGIRRGIVDITFDSSGPTWVIGATELATLGLKGLYNIMPTHASGFVVGYNGSTGAIDGKKVAGNGALANISAADMNGLVARCEYVGY